MTSERAAVASAATAPPASQILPHRAKCAAAALHSGLRKIIAMTDEPRQPNVLLIEDHRDIAGAIVDFLEHRGFAVDYAADGVTGLHLAV